MADVKISGLTDSGTLTGAESVEVVQSGASRKTTTQAIANLTPGVTDHGALGGLGDDDHTQYHNDARGDARYAPITRNVIAGAGLTGGGDLSADRTISVGAGTGISVDADAIRLTSEHPWNVDHSTLNINAGSGLTGGGALTASRTLSVATGGVSLDMLADIATATILGRTTAGTGAPEALTIAQATALLDIFTTALKGLVPASGGGTTNYLRADGTWAAPPGVGTSDHGALTGLGDDDHTQYLNNARGDARYYTQAQLNAGQLDTRYYTEAEVLAAFAAIVHTHPSTDINDSTAAGRAMLSATDVAAQTALLNNFTAALKGLAPPSGGGTTNYLRADGTWAAPPGTITGAHGSLTGLSNDDHTQYHNDARGDARYPPNTRTVSAGTGLSGGGNLAADRTISLDTASSRNADHSAIQIATAGGLQGGGTIDATRTLSIQDNGVTRAHLVDMQQNRVLGRISAGTGDPEDLTMTQLTGLLNGFSMSGPGTVPTSPGYGTYYLCADGTWKAANNYLANILDASNVGRTFVSAATSRDQTELLDPFTSSYKGLAPASGGGTTNFLRADGSWAAPTASASFYQAYASSAQSFSENSITVVDFGTVELDVGGFVAAGSNTTRVYVPAAGNYKVSVQVTVNAVNNSAEAMLVLYLRDNGSTFKQAFAMMAYANASTPYHTITIDAARNMSSGRYFDVAVLYDSETGTSNGSTYTVNRSTSILVQRLS